jgi:thioredoxin-related protein
MYIIKSFIITISFWVGSENVSIPITDEFWQTDYQQAIEQAKKEEKTIMLYFSGSDWCRPCIIWKKEVFDTESFQSYAGSKLVAVKLDFPRLKKNKLPTAQLEQNETLAMKYNNDGVFPMVVFLNGDGSVLAKSGYRSGGPDEFIKYVEYILAKK